MKQIINGKTYNTETACKLCDTGSDTDYQSDFKYEESALYVTKKGAYFIAGSGGPMSRFARPSGNMTTGGSGIVPVCDGVARDALERENKTEILEKRFNIEEA